jgi:5-methylcytosine-specific restriction enzyme A
VSRKKRRKERIDPGVRRLVYLRDNLTCVYCRRTARTGELPISFLTIDHIKAWSKGGTNHESNLCTACKDCNVAKGRKSVQNFRPKASLS